MEGFLLIFLSIVLEAIPFVMIGALISSLIHLFVSEETIARIIPKNKFLGLVAGSLMGIVFPVCECAIVPIVKRLIKKGVPIDIAITFMLAVPIVNPVVLASTYYAFGNDINMMALRGIGGLIGAILVGVVVGKYMGSPDVLKDEVKKVKVKKMHKHDTGCGCGCQSTKRSLKRPIKKKEKQGIWRSVKGIMLHTSRELYSVGRFLIAGAFLSAMMQTFVPREMILSIGNNEVSSILVMMAMAFILSLCSEADAFIARTFVSQFTTGSIVAFLVLGPMIDIKNTLMLSSGFKTKFIMKLILTISIICFVMAMGINLLGV
ncbi:MAG: permease [Cellulosilyticaceae bacterium]